MALESISKLFSDRDSVTLDNSDIQHGIERFLQHELHSDKIHCRVKDAAKGVVISVGSTALAEAVYVREKDLRGYASSQLGCSLGFVSVMLEV